MSPPTASPQIKDIAQPVVGRRDGAPSLPRRLLNRFSQVLLPILLAISLLIIPAVDSAQAAKRDGTGSQVRMATLKAAQKAAAKKAMRAKRVKQAKRAQQAKQAKQVKRATKAKQGKKAKQTKRVKTKRQAQRAKATQLQAAQVAPAVDPATAAPVNAVPAATESLTDPAAPAGTDPEPVAATIADTAPPIVEGLPGEPRVMDFSPRGSEADGLVTDEQAFVPVTEDTEAPAGENRNEAPAILDREPESGPDIPLVIEAEAPVGDAANLPEETAPEAQAEIAAPSDEAPVADLPVAVTEIPEPEVTEPVESETPELVDGEIAAPVETVAPELVETTPDPALGETPAEVVAADPVAEEAIPVEEAAPVAETPADAPGPDEPAVAVPDLVVEAISNNDKVTPGQSNTYRFRITNPAATEVRAQIAATNSLPGWTSEIRDASGGAKLPSLLTIAGGEAIEVVVVVAVPDDAVDGETNQTQFSVSSDETAAPSA